MSNSRVFTRFVRLLTKNNSWKKRKYLQQCSCLSTTSSCLSTATATATAASADEQNIIKSQYPDIRLSSRSIVQYVWKDYLKWKNHTAIVCGVTGRSYTYSDLRYLSQMFASCLYKVGFKYGDTLAIVLPNIPEYPLVYLGAIEAGLIVTTVNPLYTAAEISRQVKDSGATCVVTVTECVPKVFEAYKSIPGKKPYVIVAGATSGIPEGTVNLKELLDSFVDYFAHSKFRCAHLDSVAVLPYSSGTTGLPKGVMLTHRSITTNCDQYKLEPDFNYFKETTETQQEVLLAILPFFHIYGQSVLMISGLSRGVKIVTLPKFDPAMFLSTIVAQKCSNLLLVPPLILFLASHPNVKQCHLQSVEYVGSSAAPIGPMDVQRLLDKIPNVKFAQGYGMTETSPVTHIIPKSSRNIASIGKLLPNTEAKVVHLETGAALPLGEVGELCIRGPQVMQGYLNNPEATAETIDKRKWLHTGDLVSCDENHDFYIHDRLKELIKVKGLQVAPAELEEILRNHPYVAEAAVIGVPDIRSGEVPKAFVVVKAGVKVVEEDLQSYVAKRVSEHKQLKGGVMFVDQIPKNASGKILRKVIKEQYAS